MSMPLGSMRARRGAIVPGATGRWSASNPLNSISGGTNVVTFADLSGNARDLTQGTAGKRPTYGSGAGDTFDGVDDQSDGATWGTFIAAATHTIYMAVTPLAWSTTAALGSAHLNHGLIGENGAYLGISLRNVASNEIMCWCASTGYKGVTLPASLNTPIVITFRHAGGVIYAAINGGTEVSTACGDIDASGLLRTFRMGLGYSIYANFKFFEMATYNVSHSAAEIAQNVSFLRIKWGI